MSEFDVLRELKGGSFSSTKVIKLSGKGERVRKFVSKTENREYGLVRWQSQVRRMQHLNQILPANTPGIIDMGVTESDFYFDIPYYASSQNLWDYLSEHGRVKARLIFDQIMDLMDQYNKFEYGEVTGSFSVFFAEEVIGRLLDIDAQLKRARDIDMISADEYSYARDSVNSKLPSLNQIMREAQGWKIKESLTHGNLTLENVLYDHDSGAVILIDPYSETYSESRLGDLSQLMQSSVSLYEETVSLGEEGVGDFFKVELSQQRTGVHYFGDILVDHVHCLSDQDVKLCTLFHAAQFIRMFPFKIEKTPRLAIHFLLHGLKMIEV
jgi:hypothetical protein